MKKIKKFFKLELVQMFLWSVFYLSVMVTTDYLFKKADIPQAYTNIVVGGFVIMWICILIKIANRK